jgi:steroid 5-alpha reductase family enzyme
MLTIVLLTMLVGLSVLMALVHPIATRTGNSGWVDVVWSYGIGIFGIFGALVPIGPGEQPTPRSWLVAVLVAIWSLRLGTYILTRTLKGGDDPRYAQLRKDWGERFGIRLFGFLQIQALAAFILAVAVMVAARSPGPLGIFDGLGAALAIIAIVSEGVADAQLAAFKRAPANTGKLCDQGLWRLSRHPNYFFEWLAWIAYPVIAIGSGFAWGWIALAAPLMMYWLLVHVSGIPPLEAHMRRSRREAFAAYQARVRAFWPIPKTHRGKIS